LGKFDSRLALQQNEEDFIGISKREKLIQMYENTNYERQNKKNCAQSRVFI